MAMGRGIVLLGVALAIGVYLLSRANVGTVVRASSGVTTTTGATRSAGTSPAARATTTVPLRSPSAVKVIVANGTDVRGAASRVGQELITAHYNVLSPTDASSPAKQSAVYFAAGYGPEAGAVAQALQLPSAAAQPLPNPPPVKALGGANVVVIVGPELAGRVTTPTSAPASTTTTHRASTSTTTRASTTSSTRAPTTTTTTKR